jgi:hypothetical protein
MGEGVFSSSKVEAASNVILFASKTSIVEVASLRYIFAPEFLTNNPIRSGKKLAHAPGAW